MISILRNAPLVLSLAFVAVACGNASSGEAGSGSPAGSVRQALSCVDDSVCGQYRCIDGVCATDCTRVSWCNDDSYCDGDASCIPNSLAPCGYYVASGLSCLNRCSSNSDCSSSAHCNGIGYCEPNTLTSPNPCGYFAWAPNGTMCSTECRHDFECAAGANCDGRTVCVPD